MMWRRNAQFSIIVQIYQLCIAISSITHNTTDAATVPIILQATTTTTRGVDGAHEIVVADIAQHRHRRVARRAFGAQHERHEADAAAGEGDDEEMLLFEPEGTLSDKSENRAEEDATRRHEHVVHDEETTNRVGDGEGGVEQIEAEQPKLRATTNAEANQQREEDDTRKEVPLWMYSGKFQGDIDGVDEDLIKQIPFMQHNALRNRDLIWPNAIVPYQMDTLFLPHERRLLLKAFRSYRKRTCIRFRPRLARETSFLNIVKGHGCYSQVGKTGGKQEISLGRGCLFFETIIHELMEIQWENILHGMDSQFGIVSSAIQDTMGEPYDYESIMHYGSTAFSRNGKNTLVASVAEFTPVIGTALDLSERDVLKISKLYRCRKRHHPASYRNNNNNNNNKSTSAASASASLTSAGKRNSNGFASSSSSTSLLRQKSNGSSANNESLSTMEEEFLGRLVKSTGGEKTEHETVETNTPVAPTAAGGGVRSTNSSLSASGKENAPDEDVLELPPVEGDKNERSSAKKRGSAEVSSCKDHFDDCKYFDDYCKRVSFIFLMHAYCPATCGQCSSSSMSTSTTDARE